MGWHWMAVVAVASASILGAQNRYKVDINAETPEGKLLQDIGTEQDHAKRLPIIADFVAKHGNHAGAPWALGQAVRSAKEVKEYDTVLQAVEKLVALDPADVEMAYAGLEASVAKKDADLTIKWASAVQAAGRKALASPEPKDEEELERWKYRKQFSAADQAPKRAEYELMAGVLNTQDPALRVKYAEALAALNPQSEYLAQTRPFLFSAYRLTNQNDKALAFASAQAEAGAADEDMLLLLLNNAWEKKDPAGVEKHADRLTAYLAGKSAPAGADPAAWEKKKTDSLGAALFLKGMTLAGQSKWKETDVALREAMPHLEGKDEMRGHALFNLGLANYRMGKLNDALLFNTQCAAIKGPNQAQAVKNVAAIRQQGGVLPGAAAAPGAKKAGARKK